MTCSLTYPTDFVRLGSFGIGNISDIRFVLAALRRIARSCGPAPKAQAKATPARYGERFGISGIVFKEIGGKR